MRFVHSALGAAHQFFSRVGRRENQLGWQEIRQRTAIWRATRCPVLLVCTGIYVPCFERPRSTTIRVEPFQTFAAVSPVFRNLKLHQ
jgi:hypothetical protein